MGRRRLLDLLLNPLAWRRVELCLIAVGVILGFTLVSILSVWFLDGWPFFATGSSWLPRAALECSAVAWSGLLLLILAIRKRSPSSPVINWVTVLMYAITVGAYGVMAGPFAAPGWLGILGGAIGGFLLFGVRATLVAVSVNYAIVLGSVAALATGKMPKGIRVEIERISGDHMSAGASLRMAVLSVAFSLVSLFVVGVIVARLREREAELERMARLDGLTGVANRRRFCELLEKEFNRAVRYGKPLSCMLVDLDHFKHVNDTHGHQVGDRVLEEVARTLREGLREADLVARYGGEEFVLLLPETDCAHAEEVAARCLKRIAERPIMAGPVCVRMTASIGVAALPSSGGRAEGLVRAADEALYAAKRAGRNRVVTASGSAEPAPDAPASPSR